MRLSCPACSAAFRVPPEAVPEQGRTVRCAKCKHEWLALPTDLTHDGSAAPASQQFTEVEEMLRSAPPSSPAADGWASLPDSHEEDITQDPRFAASSMVAAAEATGLHQDGDSFHFDGADAQANTANAARKSDSILERAMAELHAEAPEEAADEEQTYRVTEEELQAFAGLVSQEELDALPSEPSSTREDDAQEEMPDFDALLEAIETEDANPKLRPIKNKLRDEDKAHAKQPSHASEKEIIFLKSSRWLAVASAVLLLVGIVALLIGKNHEIRTNAAFMEGFYRTLGFASSRGIELSEIKMDKTVLPGKTSYDLSGALINRTRQSLPVPAVRIRLVDMEQKTLRQWDFAMDKTMKPNESVPFNAKKLRPLGGTEDSAYAFVIDIGNSLEMLRRE